MGAHDWEGAARAPRRVAVPLAVVAAVVLLGALAVTVLADDAEQAPSGQDEPPGIVVEADPESGADAEAPPPLVGAARARAWEPDGGEPALDRAGTRSLFALDDAGVLHALRLGSGRRFSREVGEPWSRLTPQGSGIVLWQPDGPARRLPGTLVEPGTDLGEVARVLPAAHQDSVTLLSLARDRVVEVAPGGTQRAAHDLDEPALVLDLARDGQAMAALGGQLATLAPAGAGPDAPLAVETPLGQGEALDARGGRALWATCEAADCAVHSTRAWEPTDRVALAEDGLAVEAVAGTVSPSGGQVAVSAAGRVDGERTGTALLRDVDGDRLLRLDELVDPAPQAVAPAWSADGRLVAFATAEGLALIDLAEGEAIEVGFPGAGDLRALALSATMRWGQRS
ncbi:MAG: hypothetical protein ACQETV_05695 [Actinomycetota bacterium]